MTDLSRVFFEFSRTSRTKHNDKMAAIFMYGICAKATGTESRTESLHPTLQHVADEGGRGYFMKSQLVLRRSATGGRDVRTL